jgi:hypothetical protein
MPTRSMNTQTEVLSKMASMIFDAKVSEDGDLPFLIQLETMILSYLKNGPEGQGQEDPGMAGMAGPPPDGGAGPLTAMPGPMPGGPPPGMPPAAGPTQMASGAETGDELRRMLQQ